MKEMNVLFICSGNPQQKNKQFNFQTDLAYVHEQITALNKIGIRSDVFFIKGKGIIGYLKNLKSIKKKIKQSNFNLIHAHNGFSALLACLQRSIPVISTFHGSDLINLKKRFFSYFAVILSRHVIYVSPTLERIGRIVRKKRYSVIPCGMDLDTFYDIDKNLARYKLNLNPDTKYVLFPSFFGNKVKNYKLANKAAALIPGLEILELKGYNRTEVNLLINACDVVIITSFRETGPQVLKEALACNCPVVSTDVGLASNLISDLDGCFIAPHKHKKFASFIKKSLLKGRTIKTRDRILLFENKIIAKKIKEIYKKVIKENIG